MLNRKTHGLLCEALRRYSRFHQGEPLTKAWTGLGTATTYAPAVRDGLMEVATQPNPRHDTWWRLTIGGAKIVRAWLDQGYDHQRIEANDLPQA